MIEPHILLDQVKNTAPFIFSDAFSDIQHHPYVQTLRAIESSPPPLSETPLPIQMKIALSAHHATVATFTPTDVDIHIRLKLWKSISNPEEHREMVKLVVKSAQWDSRPVSQRWVDGQAEASHLHISGHDGEWFSTAIAAYCSLCILKEPVGIPHETKEWLELKGILQELILDKLRAHTMVTSSLLRHFQTTNDPKPFHTACAIVAHNLGDLDRVWDAWGMRPNDDPLCAAVYKLGHRNEAKTGNYVPSLSLAGAINKALLASENPRHYPLRKPKCLRSRRDYLLGIGPYFDAWGARIGLAKMKGELRDEEIAEVVHALILGFEGTKSYARALHGLGQALKGGLGSLEFYLPAKAFKSVRQGELHSAMEVSQARFELGLASATQKLLRGSLSETLNSIKVYSHI